MSCLGERLTALVDGELGHEERELALAHLAFCDRCRKEADALRRLKSRLRGLSDLPAAEGADTTPTGDFMARLMALGEPGVRAVHHRTRPGLGGRADAGSAHRRHQRPGRAGAVRPPIRELRGAALPAAGMAGALLLAGLLSGDACADSRARRGDPEALRLLTAAVDAARNVAYEGTRTLATWSPDQASTAQVKVVHTPGAGTSFTDGSGPRGHRPDAGAAEAGLTASALALLARNYRLVRAADGTVCGRRARVVEAHRP
ncbi:anti-sigma factor family protein, partial [Actinomadura kijaniata]|uniref:anti-sigma factor family protein n=1 Tax=Actinomadura kijaniata TaxID=46161 RepID=UPI003F1BA8B8